MHNSSHKMIKNVPTGISHGQENQFNKSGWTAGSKPEPTYQSKQPPPL